MRRSTTRPAKDDEDDEDDCELAIPILYGARFDCESEYQLEALSDA